MKKDISKIVGKELTGGCADEEREVFKAWLKSSEKNERGFEKLKHYWNHAGSLSNNLHTETAWQHLQYRLNMAVYSRRLSAISVYWKVAAAVLLLFSIGTTVLLFKPQTMSGPLILTTSNGQQSEAILPDGSTVWLNAATKLIVYDMKDEIRKVKLTGEAQFDVVHNQNKPFVVEAGAVEVEVVGTIFNIQAYADDDHVKTALLEGAVNISSQIPGAKKYRLKPGQAALYHTNNNTFEVRNEYVNNDVSWREGVLEFQSVSFEQLIKIIQRQYDVVVEYSPSDFKEVHYSGTLDNLRLDQVFSFISFSIPMEYSIEKNKVVLNTAKN